MPRNVNNHDTYEITVTVTNGPGMDAMLKIVCDGLVALGYTEDDFRGAEIHGPMEMKIGMVPR